MPECNTFLSVTNGTGTAVTFTVRNAAGEPMTTGGAGGGGAGS